MISADEDVPVLWQAEALVSMTNHMLHVAEPDEVIREWFDDLAAQDPTKLNWAMRQWSAVLHMNVFELEDLNIRCKRFIQNLRGSRNSH